MAATKEFTRPFLKWPGGKFRLLTKIHRHLPKGDVLVEPFAGSAALFLNTNCEIAYINDINPDLYNLYRLLQTQPDDLVTYIKKLFKPQNNQESAYYKLRDKFNASTCTLERSAIFVYLNRHGYNGLCRYNQSGYFNVPFGRYKQPYLPIDELKFFIERSKIAIFSCKDYTECLQDLPDEAVIYCDPPYIPLSRTANFTAYSQCRFEMPQQERLALCAIASADEGHRVLISNHDTKQTRELYAKAKISRFRVRRFISAKAESRKTVPELLALFEKK